MKTTIDKAGRMVIPKALRDVVGLVPGEVEITLDGAALRLEPSFSGALVEIDGEMLLPDGGITLSNDELRDFRLADQR